MTNKSAPASGEENAIRGYFDQYEFSATSILRLMQSNTFDAVSICDHAAGIMDDLVLFSGQDLIAHQIKSQRYPKAFRLRTEFLDHRLLINIVDSWHKLRGQYPNRRVRLVYILPGFPSSTDQKQLSSGGHSASFLEFINGPDLELSKDTIDASPWADFVDDLRVASALSEGEFFEFFSNLRLFDQRELTRRQIVSLDASAAKKAFQIKHLIPEIISNKGSKALWTEQDIIDKLGWRSALRSRANHNFPLSKNVQSNRTLEEALKHAINEHGSGYISLVGPPGTGKSTSLQRAVGSSSKQGVVRYLAFHPDKRHGLGRAEASDFLHDITLALAKLGFGRDRLADEDQLKQEFLNQLDAAGSFYDESGYKTLIVIDGLDHIQREESPNQNFLSVLPLPQVIPDGVLFILGSQYLELEGLSGQITQQASAHARCVTMKPLSRSAIFSLAEQAGLPDYIDKQSLFDACEGHPLVARYYIEKLSQTKDRSEAVRVLESREIGESVTDVYERVWKHLSPVEEAKHVLALLARSDNGLAPIEISKIVDDAGIELVRNEAGFLLSGLDKGRWKIFHNSFRLFVAAKTSERFGNYDSTIDFTYFSELAEIASSADASSGQKWLELRYRARAFDSESVKRLANPELFRSQLQQFRPGRDIYIDLRLAYGAIETSEEVNKLVELLMAEKEIDYRLEAVSQVDIVNTYMALGDEKHAFEMSVADDKRTDGVYELLDQFFAQGDMEEAATLYEIIEPAEIFAGLKNGAISGHESGILYDWIERAHRFRPLEEILEIVEGLEVDAQLWPSWNADLRFVLGRGIVLDDPTCDVEKIRELLGLKEDGYLSLKINAVMNLDASKDQSKIRAHLNDLHDCMDELRPSFKRVCARLSLEQSNHEVAREFLEKVPIKASNQFRDYDYRDDLESVLVASFSVARLSQLLGNEVIFERSEEDEFQNRLLEMVIDLGKTLGSFQKGDDLSSSSISEKLAQACRFIAFAEFDKSVHSLDLIGVDSLSWFAQTFVKIASLQGRECLIDLEKVVERIYQRGNNRLSKFTPFRLEFAKAVFEIDGDKNKAIRRFKFLKDLIEAEYTSSAAVELRVDLVDALSEIGAIEEARHELSEVHKETCGYWLAAKKEPQYVFWNQAFDRACNASPHLVKEFSSSFARFVLGLSKTEGGDTGHRLTYGLLKNSVAAPSQSAGILRRIISTHLVSWADMVASILHGAVRLRPDLSLQCSRIYNHLVLPFGGEYKFESIKCIYEGIPEESRRRFEDEFTRCTMVFADTALKVDLLSELKELSSAAEGTLESALDEAKLELARIRDEGPKEERQLDSYELKQKQLEKVSKLAELSELGDGRSEHGTREVDYSYAKKASRLLGVSSLDEIAEFLNDRPVFLDDTKFLIAASDRLFDLGEFGRAGELFETAKERIETGYWSAWMGGEKLAFQKLYLKRDRAKSQADGFNQFVKDLSNGRASAHADLPDLPEILDLVAPDTAWGDIWKIVQRHLSIYREYNLSEDVDDIESVSSVEDLVGFLFQIGFSLRSNILTDLLRDNLIALATDEGGLKLYDTIVGLLVQDPGSQREAAASLWKLVDFEPCRDVLIKHAEVLALADDIVVTHIARSILRRFDIEFEIPSIELPTFYQLAVIGDREAEDFRPIEGVEPDSEFWLDSPWYWTYMLPFGIKLVSDASGIEIEAIRRRCAWFMEAAGGEHAFGPSASQQLDNNLRSLDLRYSFARLMPHFAARALGQVVEELVRASRFQLDFLQHIWAEMGGLSYLNFQFPVEPRPNWVRAPGLPAINHWKIDSGLWLDMATESTIIPTPDHWFLLAEHSEFIIAQTQKRCSCFRSTLPDFAWSSSIDSSLFGMPSVVSIEHLDLVREDHPNSVFCVIHSRVSGEIRENLLSLSSKFLDQLGWRRSTRQPLEIFNGQGELVAKTVRWLDGIGCPDNYSFDRSALGCAIIVSGPARETLEEHLGSLELRTRVIHRFEDSHGAKESELFNGVSADH
jgi:hypothetical protein